MRNKIKLPLTTGFAAFCNHIKAIRKTAEDSGSAVSDLAQATAASVKEIEEALNEKLDKTSGIASAAQKLSAARKIGGASFDGSADINPYEAYLAWGGKDIAGDCAPIDMAINGEFNPNRLAYMRPADISVEYSTDGGTTWLDYGASNATKTSLTTTSTNLYIGAKSGKAATTDKLRVTLTAASGSLYFKLKKLMIRVSTNGAGGSKVMVEGAKIGSENTFAVLKSAVSLSGWSGWNIINQQLTFGGSANQTTQYRKLRFTFSVGSISSSYNSNLALLSLQAYGETMWSAPSTMAQTGHMYTFDADKNVEFPNTVKATKFDGPAAKLSTPRQIGDASFDGSADITLAQIGAAKKPLKGSVTIPTTGWSSDDTAADYPKYYDFAVEGVTDTDHANVVLSPEALSAAANCGLCPSCETLAEKIRIRAVSVPTETMAATYWIEKGV